MRITDTGITITEDFIPVGRRNRPGRSNPCRYITIHETGNRSKGGTAKAHVSYLKSDTAAALPVSWHYTVDDHAIYQHLPDGEIAWHATDGSNGPGNCTSIGIEICVNEGGDFEAAKANAASLVRLLLKEHGLSVDKVVQHNHWYAKNCPQTMRETGTWDKFLELCGTAPGPWYEPARQYVMRSGISDGTRPDDRCTRAEVWQMLYKLKMNGGT